MIRPDNKEAHPQRMLRSIKKLWLITVVLLTVLLAGCSDDNINNPGNPGGGGGPDTTAPTVTFTAPAQAETGVAINRKIVATFSESMDAATIGSAFTLTAPVERLSPAS